jgi:uncharacterized protein YkwD
LKTVIPPIFVYNKISFIFRQNKKEFPMKKTLLTIFLFVVFMISACGAKAPAETVTPTLTETQIATATDTEAPTATETPGVEASPTSTPETPIPTNTSDCTNGASFVADVTIPDNSSVPSGTTFTKTWRVQNTGTCIWGPNYALTHYSDENMLAPASTPLKVTFPGQTTDLSLELTAPSTAGIHKGYFVIKNPAGLIMNIDKDSRLWVVIDISVAVASGPTATQGSGSIPVTAVSSSGGSGFANVTCAYTTDAAKLSETINALNTYRAQNGLAAYTVNDLLTKAATAHANDMACNNLFVHIGSDGSTPASRVATSGYVASDVTENVYGSYPPLTGQGAVDWWKNDKTDIRHNQNLLSTKFTEIGVGYSFYNNFGYYVLVFAKPK